ncbi:hypothetical protein PtB15_15B193 [Puccinia triticina]|nr:hypothetical protein PtB15_15B193 [Puccinia triticina]
MAVVLVGGVSVTSGHQLPKTSPKGGSGSLTPGGRGRKLWEPAPDPHPHTFVFWICTIRQRYFKGQSQSFAGTRIGG